MNELAIKLGGTRQIGGINWTWYVNFPTREAAEEFLKHPDISEHRGIYPNGDGTFDVRVR